MLTCQIDSFPRKSLIFKSKVFVFDYGGILKSRMFENLKTFLIKVFLSDDRPNELLKRWMFDNVRFSKSKFSYITVGKYRKVRRLISHI